MNIGWTEASVIVSAIMAIATFWTIYETRRQFNEMKRQWDEDHRPRLIISVISTNDYFMFMVENIGKELAKDVKFKANDFLKKKLITKSSCDYFKNIETKNYHFSPGVSKYFMILPTFGFAQISYNETGEDISESELKEWVNVNKEEAISITCTYRGGVVEPIYSEMFRTQIKDLYGNSVLVTDDEVAALTAINTTLKSALNYYKNKERDKRRGVW